MVKVATVVRTPPKVSPVQNLSLNLEPQEFYALLYCLGRLPIGEVETHVKQRGYEIPHRFVMDLWDSLNEIEQEIFKGE